MQLFDVPPWGAEYPAGDENVSQEQQQGSRKAFKKQQAKLDKILNTVVVLPTKRKSGNKKQRVVAPAAKTIEKTNSNKRQRAAPSVGNETGVPAAKKKKHKTTGTQQQPQDVVDDDGPSSKGVPAPIDHKKADGGLAVDDNNNNKKRKKKKENNNNNAEAQATAKKKKKEKRESKEEVKTSNDGTVWIDKDTDEEKTILNKKTKKNKQGVKTSTHPNIAQHSSPPPAATTTTTTQTPPASIQQHTQKQKKQQKKQGGVLAKMQQRLSGSRFRWLNEQLYTTTGDDAWRLVQGEQHLFTEYHEGFREQTRSWPQQPVDVAIAWLKGKPASWHVADFGCGDAKLAASVAQHVHSFDLVAANERVVACNMAHVPLANDSVDVAVFCLALMGTDYGSFLEEAFRVLKPGGWLWIAEVRSRFADKQGRDDTTPLLRALKQCGFALAFQDTSNTMFVQLHLRKVKKEAGEDVLWPSLKPCIYKRR